MNITKELVDSMLSRMTEGARELRRHRGRMEPVSSAAAMKVALDLEAMCEVLSPLVGVEETPPEPVSPEDLTPDEKAGDTGEEPAPEAAGEAPAPEAAGQDSPPEGKKEPRGRSKS